MQIFSFHYLFWKIILKKRKSFRKSIAVTMDHFDISFNDIYLQIAIWDLKKVTWIYDYIYIGIVKCHNVWLCIQWISFYIHLNRFYMLYSYNNVILEHFIPSNNEKTLMHVSLLNGIMVWKIGNLLSKHPSKELSNLVGRHVRLKGLLMKFLYAIQQIDICWEH